MSKLRSSAQLLVDADFDLNSKKGINLAPGTADTDAVNVGQLNSAIDNAVSGLSLALHVPVADLAAAKAVPAIERADKMQMLVETLGLYRYDLESTAVSNDTTIIRPTDVASDAAPGRWIKISNSLTDHNLMSNIQGGAVNDYQHLTAAQVTKLNGIEALADVTDKVNVGAAINSATDTATASVVDTDSVGFVTGSTLKRLTFTTLKAFLKSYFDTLYNKYVHPNHTGDVTSVADGATTIAANAVSNSKFRQSAALSVVGNGSNALANVTDIAAATDGHVLRRSGSALGFGTVATAGIADDAVTNSKIVNNAITVSKILDKTITLGKIQEINANTFLGNNTGALSTPLILSIADVKAMLGIVSRTFKAVPAGLKNGANTIFTVAANVQDASEEVFFNGALLNLGTDYSVTYGATMTVTLSFSPVATDIILINYSA